MQNLFTVIDRTTPSKGISHVRRVSLHKYTRCLRKNCAKLFMSELRQIFINFNDFWYLDGKMAEILCYIYIFHLTSLTLSHYLVKYKSTKFYSFSGKL